MAIYKNIQITEEFLNNFPNSYFIFGDNLIKQGYGGAAKLRDHPHAIGFITKKFPDNNDGSFYRPDEYKPVFLEEVSKLERIIKSKPNRMFYISQLGGGLANKYKIWENVIKTPLIERLKNYENVVFCWENS
jgi:hypothetical protein